METIEQRILSLEKHVAQQPKSPLFAQLASYYLDTGRPKEALSLCDKGLAFYPFYTTGHLIKGKTLLALNMRAEARREFEIVHDTMPANEAVARLLAEIPTASDETLAPTSVEAPQRTAKPEEKTEQPTVQSPVAEPEPPPSAAEQVLSQFTEPQVEPSTPFSAGQSSAVETPPLEAPVLAEETPPTAEDPFGISAPAETTETLETVAEAQPDASAAPESTTPSPQPENEGEPFEAFAERMRMELIGTENTLSLDEYLHGNQLQPPASEQAAPAPEPASVDTEEDPFAALRQLTVEEPPAQEPSATEESSAQQNQIEEIAEKLREAKRITPVINFSEKSTMPPSESETPAGTGFVTPTLAEIYAKQGWFDDAIKAYRSLAASKPSEREKFEKRIQELEEMKSQQGGQ